MPETKFNLGTALVKIFIVLIGLAALLVSACFGFVGGHLLFGAFTHPPSDLVMALGMSLGLLAIAALFLWIAWLLLRQKKNPPQEGPS